MNNPSAEPTNGREMTKREPPRDHTSDRRRENGKTRRNYWAKLNPQDFARFPELPPLPYLEESRLIERAQCGDLDARNIIWRQHLRLAFSVVNRFSIPRSLLSDAIQEGALGLSRAIEKFEVHRYLAFSTYAWYWIEQYVRRFLTRQRYGIPLPDYLYVPYHRYRKGLHSCRSPGEWYDWRESWLCSGPNLFLRLSRFHRLARPEPMDSALDLHASAPHPLDLLVDDEQQWFVHRAVISLEDREREVIVRRYGLFSQPEQTLEEVGMVLGVTRERVRQIQVVAERRLRRNLEPFFQPEDPETDNETSP